MELTRFPAMPGTELSLNRTVGVSIVDTTSLNAPATRRVSRRSRATTRSQPGLQPADRYRLLFEANIAGTFRATLQGKILDCNAAFARLLGYKSREEVLASDVPGLCPLPADQDSLAISLRRERSLRHLKVRGLRRDGTPCWALENLVLSAPDDNGPVTLEGTLIEISEAEYARDRDGERDAEAMGILARGVIHDVNNLLTVVLGDCELLAAELGRDERVRALVEGVKKAGEWAASLTAGLLAKDARRLQPPQLLDLNDFLAGMEPAVQRLLGDNIRLSTSLEACPGQVLACPPQIGQVVLNLALNARDAMPRGGRLSVKTTNAAVAVNGHVPPMPPGNYVVLSVNDSGQGMDAGTEAQIFEPFFTTKKQGKGIGLAAVHEIVTRTGGFIRVESQPGTGTTFNVYLPQAGTFPGPQVEPADVTHQPARILLVEDEPLLQEMARRTLESCGYTVLATSNALEAALIVGDERESIDLLVTDLVMPEIGGRELAARFKLLRPEMKVLFMSGYSVEEAGGPDAQNGQTGFLQKPFKPGTLLRKAQEMLAGDSGRMAQGNASFRHASLEPRSQGPAGLGKARRLEPGKSRESIARLPATLRAST